MLDNFYENSEIFITGASGVVGKGLIEKLLRSCKVKRIFVLLRPSRNVCPQERLKSMLNEKIFRQLRVSQEHELSKVHCIEGDVTLPLLGISAENRQLMENVSFVFHCAATVRFDEPLLKAIAINVGGTHETLKIALDLPKLRLFFHVSTSFSNPYLTYMEPKMYPSPLDWRLCLKMLDIQLNEDHVDIVTKRIIEGFPNTYTFTKNVSESLVNDFRSQLPIGIYRPSIIINAIREPEPGFPTSPIGVMGYMVLLVCGIQKVMYAKSVTLDLVPLDIIIKACLFYAIKATELCENGKTPTTPIYIASLCGLTEHNIAQLSAIFGAQAKQWPAMKSLFPPKIFLTSSRLLYIAIVSLATQLYRYVDMILIDLIQFFLMQMLPAIMVDALLLLFGQKPAVMRIMRKSYATADALTPFLFNEFANEGVTDLKETLETVRGTVYDINEDVYAGRGIRTNLFCANCVYKIREILLNEDPKSLPLARKILHVKMLISLALQLWLLKVIGSWVISRIM